MRYETMQARADFVSRWSAAIEARLRGGTIDIANSIKATVERMLDEAQERMPELSTAETTESYDRVRRFMEAVGQAAPSSPAMPDEATRRLRAKLILEEALETVVRGLGLRGFMCSGHGREYLPSPEAVSAMEFEATTAGDLVELVDGCEDLRVVTEGTLIAAGVRNREPARAVDENNLEKIATGQRMPDGKWKKSPNHRPPDIAGVLRDQGAAI